MQFPRNLFAALSILIPGALVTGQTYVQQGNLLDASLQRGSAGLNPSRAHNYGQYSNQIVTGNITGGRSFSGFSPIRDPNALFLSDPQSRSVGVSLITPRGPSGLPSESLSNFRRDSYGVNDARAGNRGYMARPYYSRGDVVNTGGIVRGLNSPGSSQVLTPYTPPRVDLAQRSEPKLLSNRIDRSGSLMRLPAEMTRIDDGHLASGRVNPRVASSSLFGPVGRVSTNEMSDRAEREIQGESVVLPLHLRFNSEPFDARWSPQSQIQPGADSVAAGRLADPDALAVPDRLISESSTQERIQNRVQYRIQERITPDQFRSLTKAGDVYDQMQWTSAQILRPAAGDVPVAREPSAAGGGLARPIVGNVGDEAGVADTGRVGMTLEERSALAEDVMAQPLQSFVGSKESALNSYLARAEELMKQGQYYKASRLYDLARAVDFRNPLPLIGRSMALLAAGDYVSSSRSLFQAISQFEELSRFRIDLRAFIPDVAAMDRRRADLERRLEGTDNLDMRFLLGWAEYCSGMQERGLKNMNQALELAPEESAGMLSRFIDDLEQRHSGREPVDLEPSPETGR